MLSTLGELLDKLDELSVADGLSGFDLIHLAVESGPAHALVLVDRIATNALLRSKALAALERLTNCPVIRALSLGAVGQTMGLAGKRRSRDRLACRAWTRDPRGVGRPTTSGGLIGAGAWRSDYSVVMLGLLAGPLIGGCGMQANPAALLAHVSLVADAGPLLSGIGIGPCQRARHRCAKPERAVSDEVMEVELQRILDRGFYLSRIAGLHL
jgi:hypothetical protein